MKLILFSTKLYTLDLSHRVDGSFALPDFPNYEEVLVNIDAENNQWVMKAVSDTKIINQDVQYDKVILQTEQFYVLSKNNIKKILYVTDNYDNTFVHYRLKNATQLLIGNSPQSHIYFGLKYILPQHMLLIYNNGNWYIKLAHRTSIYINDLLFTGTESYLKQGDILFLYGLRIILLNDTLLINNPNNITKVNSSILEQISINQININYSQIKEVDLYSEDDYFYKTPRLRRFIETYDLKLAVPPAKIQNDNMPLILVLGPSLTMALISGTMLINVILGLVNGTMSFQNSWTRLVSGIAMLSGSLLWPNLIRRYNKKKQIQNEKIRQEKYRSYLDRKCKEINSVAIEQAEILKENLISLDNCYNIILKKDRSLWERKNSQKDFLTVRVGMGDVPINMNINFNEDEFVIEEDELKVEAEKLVEEEKNLKNVPVSYSFFNKKATAIMGITDKLDDFASNIILQLITFHSYDELKLVFLVNNLKQAVWECYKNLPHCFDNNRNIRFFGTDAEEYKTISSYLENEFITRYSKAKNTNNSTDTVENEATNVDFTYIPYYLIITDDFTKIRKLGITDLVLKNNIDLGFSFIIIENSLRKLPSECSHFITIGNQSSGILNNEKDDYQHQDFIDEIKSNIDMRQCAMILSNIPIEFYDNNSELPTNLGFLEMMRVGKVEKLNSMNRWRLNDPTKSLRAAIGVNSSGDTIYLDLHEKYHGPHGLIAGMTGSGKSEFIITYILSMAINYSPNEVAFILIDYKGGGLAGAFENKNKKVVLPHLAGVITNLDKSELNRTLVSLQSELRRRQAIFNEARDQLGESTIDIYKYQKFFREKKLDKPVPHLFVICDEFAELKSQQPEFMDNLISAARIGRSLGVHLILATQKPSGVVNDQIWSNTKFRVCLKVQDRGDSNEMLKRPEAAEIKEAGRFYLQVGYDELFIQGQSAYCGKPYIPSDTINSEIDRSINYINNTGLIIKDYEEEDNKRNTRINYGDELSNILKYIVSLSNRENVKSPRLWVENIPENIYIEELMAKYHYETIRWNLQAIIGEYDDPFNQYQGLLTLSLGDNGNTIIYGASGVNREMFLSSVIYSICLIHNSDEVNFYIFDFGSEALRVFLNFPQVGDIAFASEEEKVSKLNKMIITEIENRKKLFADYNGEYTDYIKNSGQTLPRKIFIFNNLDSYREYDPNCNESLIKYAREGLRYGIIIILTTTSTLPNRVAINFENEFVLDMPDRDHYINILGKIGNIYPASYDGRGLFKKGDKVLEYQVAQICERSNLSQYLKDVITKVKEKDVSYAPPIPILPDIVTKEMLNIKDISIRNIPLGIYYDSLNICTYNFEINKGTIVTANDIEIIPNCLFNIINQLRLINGLTIIVFDAEHLMREYTSLVSVYCDNNYGEYIKKLTKSLENIQDTNGLKAMIIIFGIEKFKSNLDTTIFNNFFKQIKRFEGIRFIISDINYKFKKYAYESWYTESVITANGIYVGKGVMDQSVIKINDFGKRYRVNCDNSSAWIFRNGTGDLIKIPLTNMDGDLNEE